VAARIWTDSTVPGPLRSVHQAHRLIVAPTEESRSTIPLMVPVVTPQLVANNGFRALRAAIKEPERFAYEPKVDGVRGLVVYQPGGTVETRNRRGERRDWLRGDAFEDGLRRLADRLPIMWHGTVLDGELIAGRFAGTMAALHGSKRHRDHLRFVAFDVPVLAGVDLRPLPWEERREGLELLGSAFDVPIELFAPGRAITEPG
jgi:ATP-dependent DNA ligase